MFSTVLNATPSRHNILFAGRVRTLEELRFDEKYNSILLRGWSLDNLCYMIKPFELI